MKDPNIGSIGVNVGQMGNNATAGRTLAACSSS
jgi:hypothetical protein